MEKGMAVWIYQIAMPLLLFRFPFVPHFMRFPARFPFALPTLKGLLIPQTKSVDGGEYGSHGRSGDIGAYADAIGYTAGVAVEQVDICRSL